MSTKRRFQQLIDIRLTRRIITIGTLLVTATVALVLAPALVGGAYVLDIVRAQPHRPRSRLVLLLLGAVAIEILGLMISLVHWVGTGFGLFGRRRWAWQRHRAYMGWYTNTLLSLIVRVIGTRIEWRDSADLSSGPVVLVARHTSFFDALIPTTLLSRRNRLLTHHVVTHGLRFSPCIDVIGHRFPNLFIKRTPTEGGAGLPAIERLGALLDERSACVIFPESTFRTPKRFERALRRLARRSPELCERAGQLEHVLPPRVAGTFALLEGQPNADVVICTNTGFEAFGSLKEIVAMPVTGRPIVIETWRISRAEIPSDRESFSRWLLDEYTRIDDWVAAESVVS